MALATWWELARAELKRSGGIVRKSRWSCEVLRAVSGSVGELRSCLPISAPASHSPSRSSAYEAARQGRPSSDCATNKNGIFLPKECRAPPIICRP